MENLIGIALTVVKTKSAAVHFEMMVASHPFTGSDVGEFGHSRKQFQVILYMYKLIVNILVYSSLPSAVI